MAGKQILLVDDYPDALEIWGLYLRSLGYDVVTAVNGLDAVDLAHRVHPDAIVLDLELPGITGFEAAVTTARVRRHPKHPSHRRHGVLARAPTGPRARLWVRCDRREAVRPGGPGC